MKPIIITGRRIEPNEACRKLNPHLFGPPVGGLDQQERKSDAAPALVQNSPRQPKRKGGVAIVVTIIACRPRILDSDNSGMGGYKALRDAIAESLQCDDGSERIQWEYGQVRSDRPGTIVRIDRV